jgi:hypothetical protein
MKKGWVNSLHQKPAGQPVDVEVEGLEITMAMRFGRPLSTRFGSIKLMMVALQALQLKVEMPSYSEIGIVASKKEPWRILD